MRRDRALTGTARQMERHDDALPGNHPGARPGVDHLADLFMAKGKGPGQRHDAGGDVEIEVAPRHCERSYDRVGVRGQYRHWHLAPFESAGRHEMQRLHHRAAGPSVSAGTSK